MRTPLRPVETFVVGDDEAGTRLDRFLVERIAGWSRRRSTAAVAEGAVRVNGLRARKGQVLGRGDSVRVVVGDFVGPLTAQPELPLSILYADEALLAIDKPAGMPAVALRSGDRGTVANALLGRYPELANVGPPLEAGLVHRLDTATSGVLAVARTAEAWQSLRAQFQVRQVGKVYVAVVLGAITRSGIITVPIGNGPGHPQRMEICRDPDRAAHVGARPAITRYRPVHKWRGATAIAVSIPTGVRHQIRVHLASIGHPVLGDPLYGDGGDAVPRLMLHAARLTLAHPRTRRRIVVRSPQPDDFRHVLSRLEPND